MTLLPRFLIAATVVAIAPAPALAQAWPAIAVAGVPTAAAQSRMVILRTEALRAAANNSSARQVAAGPALNLNASSALLTQRTEIADVNIRAKSGWSDDQGFRVSPTRVAYKRRF